MPWSNQSGGGRGNNGGGGPWGGGGGNNGGGGGPWGGGGNQPPNIEELIKKGQDRFKNFLPGGGSKMIIIFILIALVALWLMNSFYTVGENERAQEILFGEPKAEISEQGLHFHFWPFERVEKVNTVAQKLTIGGDGNIRGLSQGLMLSGDQNFVDVEFSVLWNINNPKEYLFNVRDPDILLRKVAEAAMRETVGSRPVEDVFRRDRAGIVNDVKKRIQSTLNFYGAGINIRSVNLESAAPPDQVLEAFEDVQRAEQEEDRLIRKAQAYANKKLGDANGAASQIREDALAYKTRVVQEAEGEAQRFISVYDQYSQARDVTKKRLFLETMEKVLSGSNLIITGQENSHPVLPYLPLDKMQNKQQ